MWSGLWVRFYKMLLPNGNLLLIRCFVPDLQSTFVSQFHFDLCSPPLEWGVLIMPILQVGKLILRERRVALIKLPHSNHIGVSSSQTTVLCL